MGLIDNIRGIFNKNSVKTTVKPQDNDLRQLIFTNFNNDINLFARTYANSIYDLPEVVNAIEYFVKVFSTVPRYHEKLAKTGEIEYFDNSPIDIVLNLKSNPFQNSVAFWQSVIRQLLLNNNVFIKPEYSGGELKAMYPLPMKNFTYLYENGKAYVYFYDSMPGEKNKYNMEELILLSNHCTFGNYNANTIHKLSLYETVLRALQDKAINDTQQKANALLMPKNMGGNLKDTDKKGALKAQTDLLATPINGVAMLDGNYSIEKIDWQNNPVNKDLMELVINIVYNYFGVSPDLINFKASETEFQQFVISQVKPLSELIEAELTAKLFVPLEIRQGHRIELDHNALQIATIDAKTKLLLVAMRQGVLSINEGRDLIGFASLGEKGNIYRTTLDTLNIEDVFKNEEPIKNNKEVESDGK